MFAMRDPRPNAPVLGTDAALPSEPWENHTARFAAEFGPSSVIITAYGELDASNAAQLADYVQRCVTDSKSVIVNLSGLEFFGTAGFSALHTINVRCAGADVRWAVVPSKAVSRLLRICDPDRTLPLAEAIPDGLGAWVSISELPVCHAVGGVDGRESCIHGIDDGTGSAV
jgi:anti-anti-sigma factor